MAKQTFTTGQVLTAAQMTSLQDTAMGGGNATAKTSNYILTAADAGTTVAMNAAGATTITVNTGLFAAGDTVFIQNRGAGNCTITAGTATVATAGSLVLPQNDAGILYFTATGTAIFYDYVQPGYSAPSYSLVNAGGTALTGAAVVTVSGISNADKLLVVIAGGSSASASSNLAVRFNADTTAANYESWGFRANSTAAYAAGSIAGWNGSGTGYITLATMSANAGSVVNASLTLSGGNSSGIKVVSGVGGASTATSTEMSQYAINGIYSGTSTISSVSIVSVTGNLDAGTVYVYASA
jgi:hypothetical protein